MFYATTIIEKALKGAGLKCQSTDFGRFSFVEAGFTGDNCTVKIRFISSDNDNDVKIMSEDFTTINPAKRDSICVLLNEVNREYKYAKFTMDNNGGVCAQYDVPLKVNTSSLGDIAIEIALRFVKIIDDAYPKFMKAQWGY